MRFHRIAAGLALLGALAINSFGGQSPAAARGLCPLFVAPVCGLKKDGTRETFTNACFARRAHARILHAGQCNGAICTFIFLPVCARDPQGFPRTYPNLCVAENADAVLLHKGACK